MTITTMIPASQIPIQRHVKVKSEANPYDPEWEVYFEERLGVKMAANLQGRRTLNFLANDLHNEHGFFYHFIHVETGQRWEKPASDAAASWIISYKLDTAARWGKTACCAPR